MSKSEEQKCKIAIDVMGGDNAPLNEIRGVALALKENDDFELILVGDKDKIKKVAQQEGLSINDDSIVHASEIIRMTDTPTIAIKEKKNSSMVIAAQLVKSGKADAIVSAGNTGAMLAVSTLIIGRIKGVGRPTIGAEFPTIYNKPCTVYDVGASVDSKPQHLMDYAIMADIYAREIQNNPDPTIGILSVGEEKSKGNNLVFEASELLGKSRLNFIGNVEGRDIFFGKSDIVLCDGFVGNIVLKLGESFLKFLKYKLTNYANTNLFNKLKVGLVKGALKKALSGMDYQEHGGVPLLGINGISIIGHGSSSPLAIKNMILKANLMHRKNLINKFKESFGKNE